jgi:hypothetical protein
MLCGLNRAWALQALAKVTTKPVDFSYVFPEPLGPHRWHGITRRGDLYQEFLIHSFSGVCEPRGEVITHIGDRAVVKARQSEFAQKIEWFFKAPVWTVERRSSEGVEVSVHDLRFQSFVLNRRGSFRFRMLVRRDGSVDRIN